MRILRFYIEYISIVQYKVINYSHHLIHEIHRPYWSYNWKSVFTLISQFPFFPPAIPWQSLFYSISRNSKQIFRSYTHSVWYRAEFVFSSDLFHWLMSCRLIYVVIKDRISLFLRLNNISLYIYTIFSWAIHPLVDTWCVFVPWLLWIHASENLEMQISLS